MKTILERVPYGARVAIIRLRSLGDCVLTTPALTLLKSHRPDLDVSVIVEDRFRAVFEGNPDVSSIVPPSVRSVANCGAGLCLNVHGGTRSALLTVASRAPVRAGFGHYRLPAAYNVRIPRAQQILGEERTVHTAEHLASAMFYLGVPGQEIPRARLFAKPARRSRPYAVLHPFASRADKAWPADRFVEVARDLQSELTPVFLAGPDDDVSPFGEFERLANAPLKDVMSLIAGASLFVGNDSGPAHIAAGFGIPVVVLFGPSDPVIWAPWKTTSRVITNPEGLAAIPASEVLGAVEQMKVRA
jgi:heptosyltransferase III